LTVISFEKKHCHLSEKKQTSQVNLSLRALNDTWKQPWTKETHMSFQPQFRQAVKTLGVCMQKMKAPQVLANQIASFLPRDAWPDARSACFFPECIEKSCIVSLREKKKQRGEKVKTLFSFDLDRDSPPEHASILGSCGVARYCCTKHCNRHYTSGGHKRFCDQLGIVRPKRKRGRNA
jgi:hypothetical protein